MPITLIQERILGTFRSTFVRIVLVVGVFAVVVGSIFVYEALPIHPVSAHCYQARIYLAGPKTRRFNNFMIKLIEERGQPFFLRNDVIYTTAYATGDENMDKFVKNNIRPEWFSDDPKFDTSHQSDIVEKWRTSSERENLKTSLSRDWCHVVEAAIARDGIDADARRQNPRIWPPDLWHVPRE